MLLITKEPSEHEIALAIARNHIGEELPIVNLLPMLGISAERFMSLGNNASFKAMVQSYRAELEKDHEGIRIKSAIALEDCIPVMHRVIHDRDTPPAAVVSGVKQLADMAGVSKDEKVQAGAGFSISIDLSGLEAFAKKMDEQQAGKTVIEIQAERNKALAVDAEVVE